MHPSWLCICIFAVAFTSPDGIRKVNHIQTRKLLSSDQVDHTECPIVDYFCNPSADDLIEAIKDQDITSATKCRNICIKDPECQFFTFFTFRGKCSCYTLNSCSERKPVCTVAGTCVSGQRECQNQTFCPQLYHMEGANAHWRCEGVNPYKNKIPANTACHTSCPDWRNAAGQLITAKSTCQFDGSWSDPTPFPPGDLSFPAILNKPNMDDMTCGCTPLNLTYNPNLEAGGEFHCTTKIDWEVLPAKLETTNQCHLLCDKMMVAIIQCKEGLWTGRPDLGFLCNHNVEPIGLWNDA